MPIRVYLNEEIERRLRKVAMEVYGRGSISKAAEDAITRWVVEHEQLLVELNVPLDPVKAVRGMLRHVKASGVELQHESRRIRVERAVKKG